MDKKIIPENRITSQSEFCRVNFSVLSLFCNDILIGIVMMLMLVGHFYFYLLKPSLDIKEGKCK